MKPVYILTAFLFTFMAAEKSMAQVQLPLDASNCAIFNALNSSDMRYCKHTSDLGEARGLIVHMDGSPPGQKGRVLLCRRFHPKVVTLSQMQIDLKHQE